MICEGWEGLTVDGKFPLLEWLGGWADRCVFLTVRQSTHTANIKLIQANGLEADGYVARWEAAKGLPHPCLVEMMETGLCELNDTQVAYVVSQKADTFLSGIVPRKALNTAEITEILVPVVDALTFVHEKGFVHGSVKPSSIALVDAEWKLSSDEMGGAGNPMKLNRELDTYDAPEMNSGTVTAAADMWSLGMILVEACSQRTPVWDRNTPGDLGVPDWLPQPFRDIAHECIRWDPAKRISIRAVKNLLAGLSVSAHITSTSIAREREVHRAAAGAAIVTEPAVSTLSERVAAVRAENSDELRPTQGARFEPETDQLTPRSPRLFADIADGQERGSHTGTVVFSLLVLILVGVVVGIRFKDKIRPLIAKQTTSASSQQTAHAEPPQNPPSVAAPDQVPAPVPSQTPPSDDQSAGSKPGQESQPESPSTENAKPPAQTALGAQKTPDSSAATTKPEPKPESTKPKETTPAPRVMNAKGAVLKRVMPDVASGAVQSMRRPVQVDVRVLVDSSGTVSSAQCVTQSRGNYWAKVSQQAAEGWKFKAPVSQGHAQDSYWMLLFQYSRGRTTDVVAKQLR